jgi:hypothetical protein
MIEDDDDEEVYDSSKLLGKNTNCTGGVTSSNKPSNTIPNGQMIMSNKSSSNGTHVTKEKS